VKRTGAKKKAGQKPEKKPAGEREKVPSAIDQLLAKQDMTNAGIPVEVCAKTRVIRAKTAGYEELIVIEVAKIMASAHGLNFKDLAQGNFTWTELSEILVKISQQASGSLIRILQLIFQTTKKPPGVDPDVEWDLSEEDVRWGVDPMQRVLILDAFFRVQWGWVSRVKNWLGQVTEAKIGTPETS